MSVDRRTFLERTAAATAALAWPSAPTATRRADDLAPIFTEIDKHHDEAVARLQEWIRQPSIAAENRGVNEGCELTMRMLKDAGFDQVTKIPTDGQPGIFATLDAGAPRTLGLYFMYDVKQVDPAEWSSPPWEAAIVDRPGFGKVLIGRGAVNQKGPEATFLAALHAIRAAGKKPPLNFVLVAEGDGGHGGAPPRRGRREAGNGRGPLGARRELGGGARAPRVAPHGQHRGSGRRLHRPGRQDHPAAPRGGEARPAARARHDGGRVAGGVQGAPRLARVRRHRGQHDRRVRSHHHAGRRVADPGAGRRVPALGDRYRA